MFFILLICVPSINPAPARAFSAAYFDAHSEHILISGLVSVSVALYVTVPHSHLHSHIGVVRLPLKLRLSERPITVSFPYVLPVKSGDFKQPQFVFSSAF